MMWKEGLRDVRFKIIAHMILDINYKFKTRFNKKKIDFFLITSQLLQ